MKEFVEHFNKMLVGSTIREVAFKKDTEFGGSDPRITIHLSNGAILWVSSDPEGNGNGFLHMEREPTTMPPFGGAQPTVGEPYVQRFTEEWIGKTFTSRNHRFTITDYNPRRPKFPVSATREDGKKFKFVESHVGRLLTAKSQA